MPRLPEFRLVPGRRSSTLVLVVPPSEVVRLRIGLTADQLVALATLLLSLGLVIGYQVLTRWGAGGGPEPR